MLLKNHLMPLMCAPQLCVGWDPLNYRNISHMQDWFMCGSQLHMWVGFLSKNISIPQGLFTHL